MKKHLYVFIILTSYHTIHTEFILYRVDPTNPNNMLPLSYTQQSDTEKKHIENLYLSTIYKYSWPKVQAFFKPEEQTKPKFRRREPDEEWAKEKSNDKKTIDKNEYLNALKKPQGLLNLIKEVVRKESHGQYGVTWIPTTIFELTYFATLIKNSGDIHNASNLSEENSAYLNYSIEPFFKTVDTIIQHFKDTNIFINQRITSDQITTYINNMANIIATSHNIAITQGMMQHLYPLYQNIWNSILVKYINHEIDTVHNNSFILSRGSGGFISPHNQNQTLIDYRFGSDIGISYGYSLFAGSYSERKMTGEKSFGARSLDYIINSKIGYIIKIPIVDVFEKNLNDLFTFPAISTLESIYADGESFHPRLKHIAINSLPNLKKLKLRSQLANLLSQAIIIKWDNNPSKSDQLLHQDITLQLNNIFNAEDQSRLALEDEETISFEQILQQREHDLKQIQQNDLKNLPQKNNMVLNN